MLIQTILDISLRAKQKSMTKQMLDDKNLLREFNKIDKGLFLSIHLSPNK
jgi:hypothetical protein